MLTVLKRAAVVLLVSAVSLEAFSAIAVHAHLVPANLPSYVWPSFVPFWAPRSPDFGMWHPANGHFNHVTSCHNLVYRTNADGARDRPRRRDAAGPRTVMLGDSFVEGYGLAREDRVSDRLEAATGVEHLNFGTSGGFGLTQAYLLYKTLAKRFAHDRVVLHILPDNDFDDDDPDAARRRDDPRYAPYFVNKADSYELRYRNAPLGGDAALERRAKRRALQSLLRSFSHAANALDYLWAAALRQRTIHHKAIPNAKGYSGYHDFTAGQWDRFAHILRLFLDEAAGKNVTIVVIPRPNDIARAAGKTATPFGDGLAALLTARPDVTVIDLLPVFAAQADLAALFNPCDGHWSPAGAALAADAVGKAG